MEFSNPHVGQAALLGLSIFQNLRSEENVKSIHMYKKGNYLHIIQQEFLIKDGALTEANRLIHLACIWGESTDVQVSMDLTKLKQEGEGWRCLLDFCTSPLRSIHKLLPGSATLVRDVWSSASACINWERPPHVLSSFSACLEELQLLEGVPYKHVVADPISKTSQRLQHDLWQQWGSDLELASPKFSKTFELSSLRNQTNEKNTSMLGAASSSLPTCATSKNMGSLPWIQKHAEHCTHGMIDSDHDQKEMGLNLIGVACAFLPPDLNSAINQTEGSSQCKIFSNVLPLDLNRMQFMNLEDTVHAHNKNLNGYCDHISFDFEMIQSMKSASVSYSSRDGRSLEAVNFETLNHMKALDFQSRGSNGIRKAKEQAKFSKSTSTRSGSGRLSELTKDELTHYFNMPITQASKELKVGLTVLKKRCRIFGIPRWPHRKMKSINGLIRNIQDLVKGDGDDDDVNRVQFAVEELEKQKKEMQECPGIQLPEKTKRLRQACFKASYRRRRQALNILSADSQHDATFDNNKSDSNNSSFKNSFYYQLCG